MRAPRAPHATSVASSLLAVALFAGCGGGDDATTNDGPRAAGAPVLLIVLDALNSEHLSHLGYDRETTPHLDALAADGISFRRAFSPAPYTRAGIPSIHTGRLPDVHGMVSGTTVLLDSETTLAEMFGEAGYSTRAAIANPNGGAAYHIDQGFDEFEDYMKPENGRSADVEIRGTWFHQPNAKEYVPLIDQWLDEDGETPGFYYLHFLEPHSPYYPPEEFKTRWLDPEYDGVFEAGHTADLVATVKGEIVADEEDQQAIVAMYDATLAYVDSQVGLILDRLKERGVYDDFVIVVTSDHGEAMFQHGRWGHNDDLYDEMVRVPLIVKLPGNVRSQHDVDGVQVSNIDIAPSLVEWCALAPPTTDFDGSSLEALMFDDDLEAFDRDRGLILRTNEGKPDLALRTEKDKTIVIRFPKGRIERLEHYDLLRDPKETKNVVEANRELASQRSKFLRQYADDAEVRRANIPAAELSVADRELLESLGYVDDSAAAAAEDETPDEQ